MPRPPAPAAGDDIVTYLGIRLPGWLKNQVIAHCRDLDCAINGWMIEVIRRALRDEQGLPEPPPARAPLVTAEDEIRAYLRGERILTPCGKQDVSDCTAQQPDGTWDHHGLSFCRSCGIRVS